MRLGCLGLGVSGFGLRLNQVQNDVKGLGSWMCWVLRFEVLGARI